MFTTLSSKEEILLSNKLGYSSRLSGERGMINNLSISVNKCFKKLGVYFVYFVFTVRMQLICTNMSLVGYFATT